MRTNVYLHTGRLLYAIALLAIGCIHFVMHAFPAGLLPASGHPILAMVCGAILIAIGVRILLTPDPRGGLVAAGIWGLLFIIIHLPILVKDPGNGGNWSGALEVLALCGGGLLIAHKSAGRYILAGILAGFAVLHFIYMAYIIFLIPAWMPAKTFLAWLVMFAFLAAAISLFFRQQVRWCAIFLSVMFGLWVLLLHLPRVIAHAGTETEWTSLCVAIAMTGIALLLYPSEILAK